MAGPFARELMLCEEALEMRDGGFVLVRPFTSVFCPTDGGLLEFDVFAVVSDVRPGTELTLKILLEPTTMDDLSGVVATEVAAWGSGAWLRNSILVVPAKMTSVRPGRYEVRLETVQGERVGDTVLDVLYDE